MYKTIEGVHVQDKQVWHESEEYIIEWQHLNEHLFIHVQIFEFSKRILKEMRKHFEEIKEQAKSQGYEFLFSFTKDERVIRLAGPWVVSGEHEGFKIISWELL